MDQGPWTEAKIWKLRGLASDEGKLWPSSLNSYSGLDYQVVSGIKGEWIWKTEGK